MHIVFNGLARALFRRLKERAHVDIKTQVGKRRGHHFGAAVVAVLAKFGDHHPRAPPRLNAKRGDLGFEFFPTLGTVVLVSKSGCIHTGHLLNVGAVAPVDLLQRVADFTHGGALSHRVNG